LSIHIAEIILQKCRNHIAEIIEGYADILIFHKIRTASSVNLAKHNDNLIIDRPGSINQTAKGHPENHAGNQ
jgi:hypothetical protein